MGNFLKYGGMDRKINLRVYPQGQGRIAARSLICAMAGAGTPAASSVPMTEASFAILADQTDHADAACRAVLLLLFLFLCSFSCCPRSI